jgi:hypothetical protein
MKGLFQSYMINRISYTIPLPFIQVVIEGNIFIM